MKITAGVVFGWCGFGFGGGLLPHVRLGIVHVWVCRGSVFDQLSAARRALASAVLELRTPRR